MRVLLCLSLIVATQALSLQKMPTEVDSTNPASLMSTSETWSFGSLWQAKPSPVFYAVIMGPLARKHQVNTWLSSLRKLGKWDGEAVLATDSPECLVKSLTGKGLLGDKISGDENVQIYGPPEGLKGNLHIVKREKQKDRKRMKLEKARAYHNIAKAQIPHPVSSIIYTDEDMVIGKDLTEFIAHARALEHGKNTIGLFNDKGATHHEPHTGVVVIPMGQTTSACLQAWGAKLTGIQIGDGLAELQHSEASAPTSAQLKETGEPTMDMSLEKLGLLGPDQKALKGTGACKVGEGIAVMNEKFLNFPTKGSLQNNEVAEFIHFTNTHRMKMLSKPDMERFFGAIGIPEVTPWAQETC